MQSTLDRLFTEHRGANQLRGCRLGSGLKLERAQNSVPLRRGHVGCWWMSCYGVDSKQNICVYPDTEVSCLRAGNAVMILFRPRGCPYHYSPGPFLPVPHPTQWPKGPLRLASAVGCWWMSCYGVDSKQNICVYPDTEVSCLRAGNRTHARTDRARTHVHTSSNSMWEHRPSRPR